MSRTCSFVSLFVVGVTAVACGGGDGGSVTPSGGLWLGDHVDFAVCDGEIRNVQVQDVSCAAIQDGAPCSRDASGALAGTWTVADGAVTIRAGNVEITGTFESPDRFVGSYVFLDLACCGVNGDMVVHHQASGVGCGVAPDTIDDVADEPDGSPADTGDDGASTDGTPGDTGADPVQTALDLVNAARAKAGTLPVTLDDRIVQAAQSHAQFVAQWFDNFMVTHLSVHDENPEWSGFTGVKFRDRLEHFGYPFSSGWEVIAYFNDPQRAVEAWLETLYHRVPIVHPNAFQIGYGHAKTGGARVDVIDVAGTYDQAGEEPVAWPYDGMVQVSASWSGMEEPQPYLPPQPDRDEPKGYPSGPVVTIEFPFGPGVTASAFELTDAHGAAVPSQVLGPGDASGNPLGHSFRGDSHLIATFALIPFDPIAASTTFTAHFAGTLDGAPFDKTWSFTTR